MHTHDSLTGALLPVEPNLCCFAIETSCWVVSPQAALGREPRSARSFWRCLVCSGAVSCSCAQWLLSLLSHAEASWIVALVCQLALFGLFEWHGLGRCGLLPCPPKGNSLNKGVESWDGWGFGHTRPLVYSASHMGR